MKLPSISYLLNKSKESFLRFPATLISALVSVCAAIFLIEYSNDITNTFPYINILITSALGIPLFFGLSMFNSSQNFNRTKSAFSHLLCLAILVVIYYTLPDSDTTHNTSIPYIRYGIFNVIVHLLVSFIPYLKGNALNGFWNFNKILFIRFWTSALYSGFLYIGLILALSALNLLFDVDIDDDLYFEFYVVIIGLFNTWFFVSGIPSSLKNLENNHEYPNGLKIFAQYVLLPLLTLYLIILYAYGTKIIVLWNWPKGIVSYLISCVSVLGILTVLLLYPYGQLKNNSWIKKFSRIFYFSLIPLVAILFIAIGFRIGDYGFTINRYVIVLLGVWLSFVALYFSFGKKNIKLIPMSLALILALMSFGPWSVFSVGEKSQINRLVSILEENNLLQDGKVVNEVIWKTDKIPSLYSNEVRNPNDGVLVDSLHNEVVSIINYLDKHHGFSGISHLYAQNIDSLIVLCLDSNKYTDESNIYTRSLGLSPYEKYSSHYDYYTFNVEDIIVTQVTSYDYVLDFDLSQYGGILDRVDFELNGEEYFIEFNPSDPNTLMFVENNNSLEISVEKMLSRLTNTYGFKSESRIHQSEMEIEKKTSRFDIKMLFHSIDYKTSNDSTYISSMHGKVLLKIR